MCDTDCHNQSNPNTTTTDRWIDPETRVSELNCQSGLKPYLEKYYQKAKLPEDRARCLELLTSLALTDAIKQQRSEERQQFPEYLDNEPLPAPYPNNWAGGRTSRQLRPNTCIGMTNRPPNLGPYTTSYARDYIQRAPDENRAHRPASAPKAFKEPSRIMPGSESTTYNVYHSEKPLDPAQPIRSGTASGSRRNNPHPNQGFMVWKFPRHPLDRRYDVSSQPQLTDEVMDKVMRRGMTTTYRKDYLGVPQDVDKSKIFGESYDWKARVPYTLDSTTRVTYQQPQPPAELCQATDRYGSNKAKHLPASGIIPKVTQSHYHHLLPRTSYESHYQHPNPALQPLTARDLTMMYGADRLNNGPPAALSTRRSMVPPSTMDRPPFESVTRETFVTA